VSPALLLRLRVWVPPLLIALLGWLHRPEAMPAVLAGGMAGHHQLGNRDALELRADQRRRVSELMEDFAGAPSSSVSTWASGWAASRLWAWLSTVICSRSCAAPPPPPRSSRPARENASTWAGAAHQRRHVSLAVLAESPIAGQVISGKLIWWIGGPVARVSGW